MRSLDTVAGTPGTERRTRGGRVLDAIAPGPKEMRDRAPILPAVAIVTSLNLAVAAAVGAHADVLVPGGAAATDVVRTALWLAALATPVLMPVKVFLLAALAWSVIILLDDEIQLRRVASLMAYAEIVLAFGGVCAAALLALTGGSGAGSAQAFATRLSLAGLLRVNDPFLAATLSAITLFHIPWLVYIAMMLPRLTHLGRWTPSVVGSVLAASILTLGLIRALLVT